jgi:hypothetical protein
MLEWLKDVLTAVFVIAVLGFCIGGIRIALRFGWVKDAPGGPTTSLASLL